MLRFEQDASLQPFNTLALSSRAQLLVTVHTEQALLEALNSVSAKRLPLFILSGGSNVLLPEYVRALVIRPMLKGIQLMAEDQQQVLVEVMAGEEWHHFVQYTLTQGWYGLENLSLIPGLVGAAPIQNIGAYGVEVGQHIHQIKAWHLPSQSWQLLSAEQCRFAYRDSIFKQQAGDWIITRVIFKLLRQPQLVLSYGDVREQAGINPTPQSVANAIITIRQSKLPDPQQIANAGSFFKNPLIDRLHYEQLSLQYPALKAYAQSNDQFKIAAGWLIEQAGWKGKNIGPVGMYEKQALVLVNHSSATLQDVQVVCRAVQTSVQEKFAIELIPEPVMVSF
ncbi:UDP-N-acetylmuramate dehydrogenase [Alkanindiges sp. WGS2144]|uniref:UDP-N-acetylmuramate dehydrogenase n=1 Tax=Alkanindiges sp. WGS2144 TaxID=3366808 RepID=UPI0037530807